MAFVSVFYRSIKHVDCFLVVHLQALLCPNRHLHKPHLRSPRPSRSKTRLKRQNMFRNITTAETDGYKDTSECFVLISRNTSSVALTSLRAEGLCNSFCPHGRAALCLNSHSHGTVCSTFIWSAFSRVWAHVCSMHAVSRDASPG